MQNNTIAIIIIFISIEIKLNVYIALALVNKPLCLFNFIVVGSAKNICKTKLAPNVPKTIPNI